MKREIVLIKQSDHYISVLRPPIVRSDIYSIFFKKKKKGPFTFGMISLKWTGQLPFFSFLFYILGGGGGGKTVDVFLHKICVL